MPFRLGVQILRHDGGQDDELRLKDVEDAVVGEEEAVGDVGGDPCCWVGGKNVLNWWVSFGGCREGSRVKGEEALGRMTGEAG